MQSMSVAIPGVGLLEPLHPDEVGGDLGGQIALPLLGNTGIVQQQIHDALISIPPGSE